MSFIPDIEKAIADIETSVLDKNCPDECPYGLDGVSQTIKSRMLHKPVAYELRPIGLVAGIRAIRITESRAMSGESRDKDAS